MNKSLIAVGLLAGVMSASVFADDGRINFYGSITDSACTVINNMTNPLSVMDGECLQQGLHRRGLHGLGDQIYYCPERLPEIR
ncbi:Fimbrial protein [Klebsiella michiganensis]|nr:Fimbrial protein [Klebsiella michiganensis]